MSKQYATYKVKSTSLWYEDIATPSIKLNLIQELKLIAFSPVNKNNAGEMP